MKELFDHIAKLRALWVQMAKDWQEAAVEEKIPEDDDEQYTKNTSDSKSKDYREPRSVCSTPASSDAPSPALQQQLSSLSLEGGEKMTPEQQQELAGMLAEIEQLQIAGKSTGDNKSGAHSWKCKRSCRLRTIHCLAALGLGLRREAMPRHPRSAA